jgi:hypothetical protein
MQGNLTVTSTAPQEHKVRCALPCHACPLQAMPAPWCITGWVYPDPQEQAVVANKGFNSPLLSYACECVVQPICLVQVHGMQVHSHLSRPVQYAATCSNWMDFIRRRSLTYTGGSIFSCDRWQVARTY